MIISKKRKIDELSIKTHAKLIRDIACTIFFGFYDQRRGYAENNFQEDYTSKGIYGFLDDITNLSQRIDMYTDEYEDTCSDDELMEIIDRLYWEHNPYLNFNPGFSNLINEFYYYLRDLGDTYNIILDDLYYESVLPAVLDEINILFVKFMPNVDKDFYYIDTFINKYIASVNVVYDFAVTPITLNFFKTKVCNNKLHSNEIYRSNEYGEKVLYAIQTYKYDSDGEIESIITKVTDKFGGKVTSRNRDKFI